MYAQRFVNNSICYLSEKTKGIVGHLPLRATFVPVRSNLGQKNFLELDFLVGTDGTWLYDLSLYSVYICCTLSTHSLMINDSLFINSYVSVGTSSILYHHPIP